jgi:hypothetical protein
MLSAGPDDDTVVARFGDAMRVYVVIAWQDHESSDLVGVYSTRKKADAKIRRIQNATAKYRDAYTDWLSGDITKDPPKPSPFCDADGFSVDAEDVK